MPPFSAPAQISLSPAKVENILDVLREANARSSRIATECRKSFKPTHHARKHAHSLNLSVSIDAASKLHQRHISVIPLPILDLEPSPIAQVVQAASPNIVAPAPRYPSKVNTINNIQLKDIRRPAKPILKCVIPHKPVIIDVPENVISPNSVYSSVSTRSRRGLTSKWSASTIGSEVDEQEFEEDDEMMTETDVPEPAQIRVKYSSGHDAESLDILVSPDEVQDVEAYAMLRPRFAVNGTARARISFPPMACDVQFELRPQSQESSRPLLPTRIPRQPRPQHVESDGIRQDLNSGSDFSHVSSDGVITPPPSEELPKLMIRIKRKSLIDDVDPDHIDNDRMLEKRPKYERKPWVIPANERRDHQRHASWSHRGKYI